MKIDVGARGSLLSQAQVEEVKGELAFYHPKIFFETFFLETSGDKDLKTSLKTLDKTDFFTKELDEKLLDKSIRIAIHSAKDLPEPLSKGLTLIALTEGVDSSDSLVLREGETLNSLKPGACIGASSDRREEAVKALRADLQFREIRGPIPSRIQALNEGVVDGIVIAEAALIRLKLTHLNRLALKIATAPLQGKLAILARTEDKEMKLLFSCLDTRKNLKSLYLGIDPPSSFFQDRRLVHNPIIQIFPRPFENEEIISAFKELSLYTHLIFTSKNSVRLFFKALTFFQLPLVYVRKKTLIAVGKATQATIEEQGFKVAATAKEESAEGVIKLLEQLTHSSHYFFWPHSSRARPLIADFFKEHSLKFKECALYDTLFSEQFHLPALSLFDEIIFTSPSTVDAFLNFVPKLPADKLLTPIGKVTESYLAKFI